MAALRRVFPGFLAIVLLLAGCGDAEDRLNSTTLGFAEALSRGDAPAAAAFTTDDTAATGTLDFSILAINNLTPFSPSVGTLTLPYVILSQDDAEAVTQGEVGKRMVEQTIEDAGVRIVGWGYSGFRVLTNSRKPVETVADLQGLQIRVPRNEIMIETYKSWGINPTPMAWSETFAALQQGVVHGQDNPYMTVYAMKFDEVQSHITNLRYVFSIEPLIVSEALFESLSDEQQAQILAAGEAATQASADFLRTEEAKIRDELVAKLGEAVATALRQESLRRDKERAETEAFVRLQAELTRAFSAPENSYGSLTAAEVIARNKG